MPYTKSTWIDEVLAGDARYDIATDAGVPIESNVKITLATGVVQAGSPVDAGRMSNIENALDDILGGANQKIRAVGAPGTKIRIVGEHSVSFADGDVIGELQIDAKDLDAAESTVDANAVIRAIARSTQSDANKQSDLVFLVKGASGNFDSPDIEVLRLEYTGDVFTDPFTDYSGITNTTGWASASISVHYKRIGKLVFVRFYINGTSGGTVASFTVPFTAAAFPFVNTIRAVNNGAAWSIGYAVIQSSNTVNLYWDAAGSAWAAANNKQAMGELWFQMA